MTQTENQGYYLIENSDKIKDSLQAWNTNFEKIDEDVTGNEERIESVSSLAGNYDKARVKDTSIFITDSANAPVEKIEIGDGLIQQQASPTPDSPREIMVTQGESSIKVENKNIVDWSSLTPSSSAPQITYENDVLTISGTGSGTNGKYNILDFIKANPGKTLHFDCEDLDISEFSSSDSIIVRLRITNDGTDTYPILIRATGVNYNYLIPDDTSKITRAEVAVFANNSTASTTSTVRITEPQLEIGTVATDYVEHQEQTYELSLPNGMFLGRLDSSVNYIHGTINNWKYHKGVERIVINGTETGWSKSGYAFHNSNLYSTDKPKSLCSHFTNASASWVSTDEAFRGQYTTTNSGTTFKCMPLVDMTLEEFKTWLANNTPVLVYALAESTDELITDDTLIAQLNSLLNMYTYKGETFIYSVTNKLNPTLDITYRVNSSYIAVDELQAEVERLRSNFDRSTPTASDNIVIEDAINDIVDDCTLIGKTSQTSYSGKNKFNKNDVTEGYLLESGAESTSSSANLWRYSNYIPISPSTSYVTSGMTQPGSSPARCYYDDNKNYISGVKHNSVNPFIDTSPATAYYMRESCNSSDINTVQIEPGPTATPYEQYVGGIPSPNPAYPQPVNKVVGDVTVHSNNSDSSKTQIKKVELGNIELCGIGTHTDYFYKENGTWYLHNEIGKVNLKDLTYTFGSSNNTANASDFRSNYNAYYINSSQNNGLCTHFKLGSTTPISVGELIVLSGGTLQFKIDNASSLEDYTLFLDENNPELYYQLDTATNTEITDKSLINQLEELQKLETYKDYTHIYTSSDGLAPDGQVTYLVNPFSSIEARLELLEG